MYPGFVQIPPHPDDVTAGRTPRQAADREVYLGGRFSVDNALGDELITRTLLGIYIAGEATNADLRRGAKPGDVHSVGTTIHKFQAFGVLKMRVGGEPHGTLFSLDERHPLHAELVAYLAALDRYAPTVRIETRRDEVPAAFRAVAGVSRTNP